MSVAKDAKIIEPIRKKTGDAWIKNSGGGFAMRTLNISVELVVLKRAVAFVKKVCTKKVLTKSTYLGKNFPRRWDSKFKEPFVSAAFFKMSEALTI